MSATRKRIFGSTALIAKLAVASGLVWLIVRRIDITEVVRALASTDARLWCAAFLLTICRIPVSGYRWALLLENRGYCFPVSYLTRLVAGAQFFGTITPAASGADVARGWYLYRDRVPRRAVVETILADRGLGVYSMLVMAFPAAGWVGLRAPELQWPAAIVAVLLPLATVGVLLIHRSRGSRLSQDPVRSGATGWWKASLRSASRVTDVLMDRSLSLRLLVVSLGSQLAGVIATFVVGLAAGATVQFSVYLLLVPLVWIWTMLPVSINAIGVREGAFIYYFTRAGMQPEQALAISLLVFLISIAQGLLGGVFVLFDRRLGHFGGEAS